VLKLTLIPVAVTVIPATLTSPLIPSASTASQRRESASSAGASAAIRSVPSSSRRPTPSTPAHS
jgi:hypothetical protein